MEKCCWEKTKIKVKIFAVQYLKKFCMTASIPSDPPLKYHSQIVLTCNTLLR